MDKQQFIISSRANLVSAFRFAASIGFGFSYILELRPLTRTDPQNKLLHAMFGELAKQGKYNGEQLSLEQWKMLMISAHTIATREPTKLVIGVEGEIVNLREKSSKMSVARLNSLIEYVAAYGVGMGVEFEGLK